jgi:acyl phosphate:glycerol-3-phosphate acyltransferase
VDIPAMNFLNLIIVLLLSYLVGSIPFGLIIVRTFTGKDVRNVGSGRTGGTNAMRAAGLFAGILTALGDILKGLVAGWLADVLLPGQPVVKVVAVLLAIAGHNYSIFLIKRNNAGRLALEGGAGGATAFGGAVALWPPIWMFLLPALVLVYLLIGFASVMTLSVGFICIVIFAITAYMGITPPVFILYGVGALILTAIALRPNLKRLKNGTERAVGLRRYLEKKREAKNASRNVPHPPAP